ncbi:putative ABC transport system permease protein [Nocardia transvalensis]|uniref:Putative ABC transport system permease protein n=1 Tax=Nocardia transvalensis TaxID=37333 RepID=A0A7W9UJC6_9NOCA|nr:ABC transporter permease [Nocardia transvalensis]MBB5914565.1 putative ABC transport system permease protein [Nocardia transvalensis]
MFVALRDLRAARGRFLLITLVVVMVALLVSFLSGLTAGLAHQNVSALDKMTGDAVVFADTGGSPSYDSSALSADQVRAWRDTGGVVEPVGIGRGQASADGSAPTGVALFGTEGDAFGNHIATGTVALSERAAQQLSAAPGDRVSLGTGTFTVASIGGDDWYSHTPVVWMTLPDWRSVEPRGGAATVLLVSHIPDLDAANAAAHTTSTARKDALSALSSYQAENGSLTLMTVLLFAISALVIGAFFTVWTIQRTPDIAVLKALGATTGSLARDALGQALIVLLAGVALGVGITAAAGAFLGDALPFVLDPTTTLLPAAALIVLGLIGAACALRFLVTADPLTALNQSR